MVRKSNKFSRRSLSGDIEWNISCQLLQYYYILYSTAIVQFKMGEDIE